MAVEGGTRVIKYLLFIFNLLFLLAGLALIIIGAVAAAKLAPYSVVAGVKFNGIGIFLIVIGIIVFLIAFFGCLGAYKESYCLLIVFIILLVISFLALIAAIIGAFVMRNKVYDWIDIGIKENLIPNYNATNGTQSAITKLVDEMQQNEKCCGSKYPGDWQRSNFYNGSQNVPDSCCTSRYWGCGKGQSSNTSATIYHAGCSTQLGDLIFKNVVAVGGAAAAIAILQFIGIIFASCLANGIRKEYSTV